MPQTAVNAWVTRLPTLSLPIRHNLPTATISEEQAICTKWPSTRQGNSIGLNHSGGICTHCIKPNQEPCRQLERDKDRTAELSVSQFWTVKDRRPALYALPPSPKDKTETSMILIWPTVSGTPTYRHRRFHFVLLQNTTGIYQLKTEMIYMVMTTVNKHKLNHIAWRYRAGMTIRIITLLKTNHPFTRKRKKRRKKRCSPGRKSAIYCETLFKPRKLRSSSRRLHPNI